MNKIENQAEFQFKLHVLCKLSFLLIFYFRSVIFISPFYILFRQDYEVEQMLYLLYSLTLLSLQLKEKKPNGISIKTSLFQITRQNDR